MAKFFASTVADGNNSILNNGTIAVPLKYPSNCYQSFELFNWKDELKLRWTKHCVLALVVVENNGVYSNNSIFNVRGTKFYVPFVTLLAKVN